MCKDHNKNSNKSYRNISQTRCNFLGGANFKYIFLILGQQQINIIQNFRVPKFFL